VIEEITAAIRQGRVGYYRAFPLIKPANRAAREMQRDLTGRLRRSRVSLAGEKDGQVSRAEIASVRVAISVQRSPIDAERRAFASASSRTGSRQRLQSRNRHSADHHRTESSCPEDSVLTDDGTCKCVPTCPPPKCRPGQRPIEVRPAKPETPGSCCPLHDCRPPGNYERS